MSPREATDLLVIHDVGDERGGAVWRDAFEGAGWAGGQARVVAPDLPGHAGAPPPIGGHHEFADALLFSLRELRDAGLERPVVLGVGTNGWSAWALAVGGRVSGLVLVDGLGGPWHTPDEAVARQASVLRALSSDPSALAPAPPGAALDPRLEHFPPGYGTRGSTYKMAEATTVPTLLLQSPAAALSRPVVDEVAAAFGGDVAVVEVPDRQPATVAAAVCAAQATTRNSISWVTEAITEPSSA